MINIHGKIYTIIHIHTYNVLQDKSVPISVFGAQLLGTHVQITHLGNQLERRLEKERRGLIGRENNEDFKILKRSKAMFFLQDFGDKTF